MGKLVSLCGPWLFQLCSRKGFLALLEKGLTEDDGVLAMEAQFPAGRLKNGVRCGGSAEVGGYRDFLRLCRVPSTARPASQLPPLANEEQHMLLIPAPALTP